MEYRLDATGISAKPDYYRGDEAVRSSVLGAETALAEFLP